MATYAANTTIKFLQAVTLTGNSSYTVPANSYAIISRMYANSSTPSMFNPGGSASVSIDGQTYTNSTDGSPSNANYDSTPLNIYIPAGKVITTTQSGKAGSYVLMSVFTNTP